MSSQYTSYILYSITNILTLFWWECKKYTGKVDDFKMKNLIKE